MVAELTVERPVLDQAKTEAFFGKVMGDLSGLISSWLVGLGDRHGLFADLANRGPASAAEFAGRAGIDDRYAREWLAAMASAGYLEYDPTTQRFALPPEHAMVVSQEGSPFFVGGFFQQFRALCRISDRVAQAFVDGKGVPISAYDDDWFGGMERNTSAWFDNFLVQQWIPAMPDVQTRLERGALVADVGCGRGRALIRLAEAYPNSRFVGYDLVAQSVERASISAADAGVADRVRFAVKNIEDGLPQRYDVVTAFDVVHDAAHPVVFLRRIRQALQPDGIFVCFDFNSSEKIEKNAGPVGTFLYGSSIAYCMATALAEGGEGLGAAGLPESKLRSLSAEAGFTVFRRVPIDNPFNNLYELRP
jgi:2-polyprenyl-3-methyl-5-hydroxy-6-metoxy-1,4-benzoquinol methylase